MDVTVPLQSTSPGTPTGVGVGVQGSGSVGTGRIRETSLFSSFSSSTCIVASTEATFSPLLNPENHSDTFSSTPSPPSTVCWAPFTSTTNGPASTLPTLAIPIRMPSVVVVKLQAPPVSNVTDMPWMIRSGFVGRGVGVGPKHLIWTVAAASTVCASVNGSPSRSRTACPRTLAATVTPPSASLRRKPLPSGCSVES